VTQQKKPKSRGAIKSLPKSREQRNAENRALAMWALLGEGGAGFGGQLRPEIEKAEREALLSLGLVMVEKRQRSYWLEVTDQGWDWAEQHLADALPDKTFGGAFVLRAWLTRLQAFMQARDFRLADVLGTPAKKAQPTANLTASPDYAGLRGRIRAAYLEVAGGFNRRALLKDIRAKLADVDRDMIDQALERMHFEDGTMLMTLDNPREITAEVRAAELAVRGEPMHILWIVK